MGRNVTWAINVAHFDQAFYFTHVNYEGDEPMRAKTALQALAAIAIVMLPSAAWAGYCGAARYNGCTPCCQQRQCHTVMKTVRCVKWERQCETRHRTVYDRVCENKVVNVTNYVREQRTKQVCYTVCKPVWETKQRTYTVCKPVWETKQRTYTVNKPVWETRTKEVPYTVSKPVWETRTRNYTVNKPVWETRTREVPYSVRVAVPYTKTIQVRGGHWQSQSYTVPGKVHTKTVRDAGTFSYDAAQCRCVYCPGPCRTLTCQAPDRTCCKRVWVPTCESKEICCTRYECQPRTRTVCYKVCRMVPETKTCTYKVCRTVCEQRTRTCCYKVCHMVPETKTCCYKVCRMVPETKTCCYKVCRMVPEQRTKTCCYKVCHMVPETKTCCYKTCRMVPEQRTKTVCYSVCKPVCSQKTISVTKCVPRQVPYTVSRRVRRVYCKQVPVCVCSPCCR